MEEMKRNLLKELMSDANKMHAYVRLESAMKNFIEVMGDIKIYIDIQTKKDGDTNVNNKL